MWSAAKSSDEEAKVDEIVLSVIIRRKRVAGVVDVEGDVVGNFALSGKLGVRDVEAVKLACRGKVLLQVKEIAA